MNHAIQETEKHFHTSEVWCEPKEVPVAGVNEAVVAGTRPAVAAPYFQIDAGDNAWGSWICIKGSGDTPSVMGTHSSLNGYLYYDLHKIGVQTSERNSLYYIQIGYGTVAVGALTGPYTTIWYNPTALTGKSESIEFRSLRTSISTQAWARALCPGQDTAKLNFNYGLHFYVR